MEKKEEKELKELKPPEKNPTMKRESSPLGLLF